MYRHNSGAHHTTGGSSCGLHEPRWDCIAVAITPDWTAIARELRRVNRGTQVS
ncbi:hypothetical protein BDW71DRAFT_172938 [Aspergillus fruticulosus]